MNTVLVMTVGLVTVITIITKIDAQSDKTLSPGERGADVVRAVISKIEAYGRFINFDPASTSPVFMRVMAYVETRDGAHADPNGGGIWNITDTLFNRTQCDPLLDEIIMRLKNLSNSENYIRPVDWRSFNYSDLSIPLYSGLAVRLLIHLNSVNTYILGPEEMHAGYWVMHFKTGISNLVDESLLRQWNTDKNNLSRTEGKLYYSIIIVII